MGAGILVLACCLLYVANGAVSPTASRIAGGSSASITEYPFATSLLTNAGSGTYWQACGGTILTRDSILSAASCFETDGITHPTLWWRARVGSPYSNAGGTTHIIRLITPHPDYQAVTRSHDIAVLRTTIQFDYSDSVGPAAIAGSSFTMSTHQPITAIGWGVTSHGGELSSELRSVDMWVVNHETCRSRYAGINVTINDYMICAGWLDVGVRAQCEGDAGSPLLLNNAVVGVFSRVEGCALGWYPGINTKMSSYTSWVAATAVASLS